MYNLFGEPLWQSNYTETSRPKSNLNETFLLNVTNGYRRMIENNLKSTGKDKEEIQHDFIRLVLNPYLSDRYLIYSKTEGGGIYDEYELPIYAGDGKKIDIVVYDTVYDNVVLCINCKFPLASYMKNMPNYEDILCGESYRLHKANPDTPIFNFIIMMSNIPVFNKDNDITRFDNINDEVIKSFDTLARGIVKEDKFLKGFALMVIDDNVVNENLTSIKTLDRFKWIHQNPFSLEFSVNGTYDNMIYNDFDRFINTILDCVKEYEKTH